MEAVSNFFANAGRYLLTIQISDIIDILVIAFIIYKLLRLIKRTNSVKILATVVVILALLWVSRMFDLFTVNYLLSKVLELGFLALVVVFQPELRRIIDQVANSSVNKLFRVGGYGDGTDNTITQTVVAATELSRRREGALIVFERSMKLDDVTITGTLVNADVGSELLRNIFYPKAPLHDGAVIIRNNRILAAGCMLPMSGNVNISKDLGMRHRAGIGMSERSDAVSVIVSEETGAISVAVGGMIKMRLTPETLERLLQNELRAEEPQGKKSTLKSIIFKVRNNEKAEK